MNAGGVERLQRSCVPRHVAIIMDGNGRWATNRNLPRKVGHWQGAEAARRVVRAAAEIGVDYITLFGFSSENWHRPESEVLALMGLMRRYLSSHITRELHDLGARLRIIGNRERLPSDIVTLAEKLEAETATNDRLNVTIALSYGGREEIAMAARRLAEKVLAGELAPSEVDEVALAACLPTAGLPAPDLLIRTGGEKRISNFLIWQVAYSELLFVDQLWPEFGAEDLRLAIAEFGRRERRYGGLAATG